MDVSQFADSKGVKTALEAAALAAANTALRNARVITPYLTPQQTKNLQELFGGSQLRFEPKDNWSHPVQRVVHDALEAYVRRAAGSDCLEVGAHPRSINKYRVSHRCFLPPVGRDEQRWQVAPRRGLCNIIRKALRNGVRTAKEFCQLGFQVCSVKAEVGVALYSLHDMRPADVACAMARHGMRTLYVVLHLPEEALLPPGVYTNKFYGVVNTKDRTIVTYADDTCAGYIHKTAVLREWVRATGVAGRHPMLVERVKSIGCHFVLLCTATDPMPMPYTPYPRTESVYVRNVYGPALAAGLFTPRCCVDAMFYAVPRRVWQRLMMFGTTLDDDAFCCSRLLTYLRGISTKVTVGNVVANEGWQPEEQQLTAVAIAAYLTVCHQRWVRTQGISRGVRRLQAEHAQSFWFKVWEMFTNTGTVPGYSAGFYRQLATWISAGLVIDHERKVFDARAKCGCCCACGKPGQREPCTCLEDIPEGGHGIVKVKHWPVRPAGASNVSRWKTVRVRADSVQDLIQPGGWAFVPTLRELAARALTFPPRPPPGTLLCRTNPRGMHVPLEPSAPPLPSPTPALPRPTGPVVETDAGSMCSMPPLEDEEPAIATVAVADRGETLGAAAEQVAPGRRGYEELLHVTPAGAMVVVGNILDATTTWRVNPANASHSPGGGLCGMFHRRWPHLWPVSGAVVDAPSGPVIFQDGPPATIHAPGPDYRQGPQPEALRAVYRVVHQATGTVACPLISAGIYRAPIEESYRAWEASARSGDLLYVQRSLVTTLRELCLGAKPVGRLVVDKGIADMVNYGLQTEPAPYGDIVAGLAVEPYEKTYTMIAGVPGSGKSTGVNAKGAVVVAPTKQLARDWMRRGATALTPHIAAAAGPTGRVIVDEAFAIPPHLLAAAVRNAETLLLLGDPKQIPALDFDDRKLCAAIDLRLQPTVWRNVTHRCPWDVCKFLQADYPGMTTTSRVIRSVVFTGEQIGQKIVFTQIAKQCNPGSITVHEAQGSTYSQVTVIATLDARGLIASSRAHAIVALTRHTDRCSVIDRAGMLAEIGVTDAMFNNIELQLVTPEASVPAGVVRMADEVVNGELGLPPAPTDVASALTAEAIGHEPLDVAAVNPPGPALEQGLLYMPERLDGKDEVVKLMLSDTVHCRLSAPTSRLAVINTLVGRYGRATKITDAPVELMDTVEGFWRGIAPLQPTTIEYGEMCRALLDKGQDGSLIVALDLCDKECSRITFFQKDCAKFTLEEVVQHGKVGQGISAWPKTLCALFGPWFRAIEKQLVSNLPPGYFYGDLYTESDLHRAVLCASADQSVFENDFSEFDSTQNNVSLGLECDIMARFGMPSWMIQLYHLVRSYWILVAPKEALRGCWKKHSGEPGTLLWNTVWNMTVLHHVYEFDNPTVLCFKGDDSVVVCDGVTSRPTGAQLVADCGLKMKDKIGPVGVFSNLLVFPGAGVVKDVLRQWGRLTEKNWGPGSDRMADLEQACRDFVSGVLVEGKEALTVQLVASYYGVETGLIEVVFGALKACAEGREDLMTVRLPVLNLAKED
uniref:Non-structural polyprotein n=1 Tax=Hepatitis E virus TaxID=1678143 RepID=A0A2Z5CVX2_HEV|nr:non-structural polyprotein [Hepatitis E virus]